MLEGMATDLVPLDGASSAVTQDSIERTRGIPKLPALAQAKGSSPQAAGHARLDLVERYLDGLRKAGLKE